MKVAGAARPAVVDLEGQALLGEAMRGGHDGVSVFDLDADVVDRSRVQHGRMEITLLHVADCPNLALAGDRVIAAAEQAGLEVTVDEQLVRDPFEAARTGLTGSPTILIDGADPFATA